MNVTYKHNKIGINIKDYDYYISFGNSCISASCLEFTKLKKKTYAFDWCVSSLNVVYDCLENDFKDLIIVKKSTYYKKFDDMYNIYTNWNYLSKNYYPNKYLCWYPHYPKDFNLLNEIVLRRNKYLQEDLKDNNKNFFFYILMTVEYI